METYAYTNLHMQNFHTCTHILTKTLHRRGTKQLKEKPRVVADYNQYMLGVDKMDQLVSYYSFLHKSVKWWRKVFCWTLEVATVNSYILYKEQAKQQAVRPMAHLAYRRLLIDVLSEPLRSGATPRLRTGPRRSQTIEHLQPVKHFLHKVQKRKDCVVCSNREEGGVRHLTLYVCKTCTSNPALCPSQCFEKYHTQRKYHTCI